MRPLNEAGEHPDTEHDREWDESRSCFESTPHRPDRSGASTRGGPKGQGSSSPAGSATFQAGQITAKLANGLQIDHKHYPLDTGVTITDDEGRTRELKDLVRGSLVQFHLKQGRVDKIMLLLPK